MLRMRKLTDYGFVLMTEAARDPERTWATQELADAARVPPPTAAKVLKTLGRGGLLESRRGKSGGYSLARPAREITVADILQVMEGPIGLTECSTGPGACAEESHCSLAHHWPVISGAVHSALASVTLSQLLSRQEPSQGDISSPPVPQPAPTFCEVLHGD